MITGHRPLTKAEIAWLEGLATIIKRLAPAGGEWCTTHDVVTAYKAPRGAYERSYKSNGVAKGLVKAAEHDFIDGKWAGNTWLWRARP